MLFNSHTDAVVEDTFFVGLNSFTVVICLLVRSVELKLGYQTGAMYLKSTVVDHVFLRGAQHDINSAPRIPPCIQIRSEWRPHIVVTIEWIKAFSNANEAMLLFVPILPRPQLNIDCLKIFHYVGVTLNADGNVFKLLKHDEFGGKIGTPIVLVFKSCHCLPRL
ncbi:hypothetical protein VNO77_33068 [Canavalia gladiata]|uniref:Uncharacterized protein n=1 Tax=Canavalia gladiata TaxID=3824 RepID=A0AAN9KE92_CANGL